MFSQELRRVLETCQFQGHCWRVFCRRKIWLQNRNTWQMCIFLHSSLKVNGCTLITPAFKTFKTVQIFRCIFQFLSLVNYPITVLTPSYILFQLSYAQIFYWNPWSHFLIVAVLQIYTFVKIIKFVRFQDLIGHKFKVMKPEQNSFGRVLTPKSLMVFRVIFMEWQKRKVLKWWTVKVICYDISGSKVSKNHHHHKIYQTCRYYCCSSEELEINVKMWKSKLPLGDPLLLLTISQHWRRCLTLNFLLSIVW